MTDHGSRISVALVDDQDLFRAGIRMLIESQEDMFFVGEAINGEEAVVLAAENPPDVLLMDLRMPVLDGVTATRQIVDRAKAAGTELPKIIALTTFNRDQAVVDAVHAGASGYLLKSAEPEFLLAAIRTVHSGYSVIAPGSIHSLFEHAARTLPAAGPDLSVLDALSGREGEVFLLAAKGLSNSEMAESLFVSEATIKTHLRNVLDKLDLRTRVQLIAFAHEHRLLG
ncbi:DNA-binding NarL/FixJ family response regulator [Arthrobacter pigmenti]|uniref:DNA-binding NarL/FixJ family response regulator n=1 Tax=Arthrobacter pigmenti TaxID=271432 RepID=A0A846RLA9_9MICC|nr:response regulator transcription factor [Arthrobacter pigmenti]NJC21064.1 DNA-binding NarL/FixJ family response regulator [Arthrobacter pigmenti]